MDDKEIIKMYWDRDQRAISETSVKYGPYCTAIAVNILNDLRDAEECVNDTYINTWETIPPNKPVILSAFLGKIVRNLPFNKYKHEHRQKRGGFEIEIILDELCEIVSDTEDVEDSVIGNELSEAVNRFVSKLPSEKQYIFVRRYWYSDSLKTIAGKCSRTENSVSVELNRIRGKLKTYLNERGYDI